MVKEEKQKEKKIREEKSSEIEEKEEKQKERKYRRRDGRKEEISEWIPKTKLGRDVKEGKIKKMDEIFAKGLKILEYQIVDKLLPNLESDIILIGQAKGKFGGGKRRIWRQTQKKSSEGNVPKFSCMAVVGDKEGHIGIGRGKSKETLPAKEKAFRKAKLNLIKIKRGCGSFDCTCSESHSIPLETEGKSGSVKIKLMPAPKGTGLVVDDEVKKVLGLAGIKDIYSKSYGHTKTKFNMIKAVIKALQKLDKFIQ
jgi:small subunit ribosomal protein S5